MSSFPKSVRSQMKQNNQYFVLQLIQGRGPISRKDIVELSDLSPAAVSNITGELIERELVYEVGEAESSGRVGRREVFLKLNARAGFVIGVAFARHAIVCILTDLDADIQHVIETPLHTAHGASQAAMLFDPHAMRQATIQAIEQLMTNAHIDHTHLFGIGVAVEGIVDPDAGVSRIAPHFGWHNVPIAAPLAAHFGIPIHVENGVRALTIAEQWFGAGRGIDHFAVVAVGQGIGAGVVTNGHIYRGALAGAGEFGHIVFQFDGPRCSCGNHGCIEALAAESAIFRQVQEALASGKGSTLAGSTPLTLEAVARAADTGDVVAQHSLATAGRWLGVGLTSLVNILNPQLLIITDELVRAGHWYFEPMEATLREYVFDGLADSLRIIIKPGDHTATARGAACVVLSALFTAPMRQDAIALVRAVR